jgi:hypothetical protein
MWMIIFPRIDYRTRAEAVRAQLWHQDLPCIRREVGLRKTDKWIGDSGADGVRFVYHCDDMEDNDKSSRATRLHRRDPTVAASQRPTTRVVQWTSTTGGSVGGRSVKERIVAFVDNSVGVGVGDDVDDSVVAGVSALTECRWERWRRLRGWWPGEEAIDPVAA